jgi:molybdenum cofactor synthesis domain-containing protein
VEKAEGLILCHDITEIKDGGKGPGFRRGHVVRREDIPHLLRIGKRHLYVWDTEPGLVHEDDAARRIAAAISGPGTCCTGPCEGRVNLTAACQGQLTVHLDLLAQLNSIPHVTIATKRALREVRPGEILAGTRVIPLAVPESTVALVENCCKNTEPLLAVQPFLPLRAGIVITGSEVYSGKVEDAFGPVLRRKFAAWGSPVIFQEIVPDEPGLTADAIRRALSNGAQLVVVSGGMSVDPDDKTPAAIRAVGGEVITYGAPVFPGAMFMLAYRENTPILGLPGCVMYRRATIFDVIMPRILTGRRVTPHDITSLAHGGLCASCPDCIYPHCAFGV